MHQTVMLSTQTTQLRLTGHKMLHSNIHLFSLRRIVYALSRTSGRFPISTSDVIVSNYFIRIVETHSNSEQFANESFRTNLLTNQTSLWLYMEAIKPRNRNIKQVISTSYLTIHFFLTVAKFISHNYKL